MEDLYEDLENYAVINNTTEDAEKAYLKYQIQVITDSLVHLQKDHDKLKEDYRKLEINYTTLWNTARTEIERKTNLISILNAEKDKLVLRYLSNSNNKYPDYNNKYNQHPHEFENKRYDVFSKDSMTEKVIEDQNLKLKSSAEKSICKNDVHKSLDSDDQMTSKRTKSMHLNSKNEPDQFTKERYDCPRKEGIKKTENYNKNCQVSSTNKDKQENHESRYEYVDDKKRVYEKGQNIVNRRKSLTITSKRSSSPKYTSEEYNGGNKSYKMRNDPVYYKDDINTYTHGSSAERRLSHNIKYNYHKSSGKYTSYDKYNDKEEYDKTYRKRDSPGYYEKINYKDRKSKEYKNRKYYHDEGWRGSLESTLNEAYKSQDRRSKDHYRYKVDHEQRSLKHKMDIEHCESPKNKRRKLYDTNFENDNESIDNQSTTSDYLMQYESSEHCDTPNKTDTEIYPHTQPTLEVDGSSDKETVIKDSKEMETCILEQRKDPRLSSNRYIRDKHNKGCLYAISGKDIRFKRLYYDNMLYNDKSIVINPIPISEAYVKEIYDDLQMSIESDEIVDDALSIIDDDPSHPIEENTEPRRDCVNIQPDATNNRSQLIDNISTKATESNEESTVSDEMYYNIHSPKNSPNKIKADQNYESVSDISIEMDNANNKNSNILNNPTKSEIETVGSVQSQEGDDYTPSVTSSNLYHFDVNVESVNYDDRENVANDLELSDETSDCNEISTEQPVNTKEDGKKSFNTKIVDEETSKHDNNSMILNDATKNMPSKINDDTIDDTSLITPDDLNIPILSQSVPLLENIDTDSTPSLNDDVKFDEQYDNLINNQKSSIEESAEGSNRANNESYMENNTKNKDITDKENVEQTNEITNINELVIEQKETSITQSIENVSVQNPQTFNVTNNTKNNSTEESTQLSINSDPTENESHSTILEPVLSVRADNSPPDVRIIARRRRPMLRKSTSNGR